MLAEKIIARIRREGPINFRDFMETSLYDPGLGYYTSVKKQIGKNGDYYTSAYLTPAFGFMIAKQMHEMWQILSEENFTIIEYGAGEGLLCYDILTYFKNFPELYSKLNYYIIEKSPSMRERQKEYLKEKVQWYNNGRELQQINGCVLSNELIDNFPVHQVVMKDDLMEIFVDYRDNFIELLQPANDKLKDYFKELNIQLPNQFRTEVCLDAIQWIDEIACFLKKGYVLTIDYGDISSELYCKRKSNGTLMCYNKHTVNDDVYSDIGRQDITSYVNFSALTHWGLKRGLEIGGYTDQAHFLLSLGFKDWFKKTNLYEENLIQIIKKESFLTHMLLVEMGTKYKVLIQQKGIPVSTLKGFQIQPQNLKP